MAKKVVINRCFGWVGLAAVLLGTAFWAVVDGQLSFARGFAAFMCAAMAGWFIHLLLAQAQS